MSSPPIATPSNAQSPTDFTQALDLYKTNYVQYRATGLPEYKVAYESAETWISQYLQTMSREITNDAEYVNKFIQDNANANPELTQLQSRFQRIRQEGPALQDKYATVQRVKTEVPEVDYTEYYVKVGLIAGFVGMIALFAR